MSDGTRIWDEHGQVVAERAPTMTRREALDRLSVYALDQLRLHPELLKPGPDVGMREAMRRARQALPDAATAAH